MWSRCMEEGRLHGGLEGSRGQRGVVEEGVGRVEWEAVALLDPRFRMEDDKSREKGFDHVCNP